MFITGRIYIEVSGQFDSVDAFKAAHPEAEDVKIDGWADAICEKGHPYISELGCVECYDSAICEDCGHTRRECRTDVHCIPF